METTIVYWGYIGIMEKKMETTIVYLLLPQSMVACFCLISHQQEFEDLLSHKKAAKALASIGVETWLNG